MQEYLKSLPASAAARVLGSRERLAAVLGGQSVDKVVNAGRDPAYHLARLGDNVTVDREFKKWASVVLSTDYKPRHEYRQVGVLPDFVLPFANRIAGSLESNAVFISDTQLRHGQRPGKSGRDAALPVDALLELPARIGSARWVHDISHNNLLAFFEVGIPGKIGKAAVHLNHVRRGNVYNAVITTGLVNPENENALIYRASKK